MHDSKIKIFVLDTSPLITLAAADSLDYLLFVQADIIIPDAVLHEATRDISRLGAQQIIEWAKINHNRIEIAPTQAYAIYDMAREVSPNLKQPNLGEAAAVEVVEEPGRLNEGEIAILLCEETNVLHRVIVQDRRKIVEISTLDYLRLLEENRKIQSADYVFQRAEELGRQPSRKEKFPELPKEVREAVQQTITSQKKKPF